MKRAKLAVIATAIFIAIFTCAHFVERHIEGIVHEKMRDLPFDVAEIDYGIFLQRLTLYDCNFEYYFTGEKSSVGKYLLKVETLCLYRKKNG